jgi:type I restriction enzyme R subunit
MSAFSDFDWEDLAIEEQAFEDYKSKYLDIHEEVKVHNQKEKVSILNDVDFELELIHKDEINVGYIIQLLIKLKSTKEKDVTKTEKEINNLLNTDAKLRSKRELIERFIIENLPQINSETDVNAEFEKFWQIQQIEALDKIIAEENLSAERTQELIDNYLFAERKPLRDEILDLIEGAKPKLLERQPIGDRILNKIMNFIETFVNGMA